MSGRHRRLAEGVKRARTDIAVNNADTAQCQRPEIAGCGRVVGRRTGVRRLACGISHESAQTFELQTAIAAALRKKARYSTGPAEATGEHHEPG
jgi:hypothetical protein